jgi:hypothetical protein
MLGKYKTPTLDLRFLEAREWGRILIATRSEDERAQANKHIYIYICVCVCMYMYMNITPFKEKHNKTCKNRARYYSHATKRNATVGATVEKLSHLL